jgi:enterochelin esterase family protein
MRWLGIIVASMGWAGLASAQDMTLMQILPPNTTWTKSDSAAVPIKGPLWAAAQKIVPAASGVAVSPDGGRVVVAEPTSKYLWTFSVAADGSWTGKERYYELRTQLGSAGYIELAGKGEQPNRPAKTACNAQGLAFDPVGRLYAATELGVQVFDPTGRLIGVLSKPNQAVATDVSVTSASEGTGTLSVRYGDVLFTRPLMGLAAPVKK